MSRVGATSLVWPSVQRSWLAPRRAKQRIVSLRGLLLAASAAVASTGRERLDLQAYKSPGDMEHEFCHLPPSKLAYKIYRLCQ